MESTGEKKMTIKQKIKKAKAVYAWVLLYNGGGEYIRISKKALLDSITVYESLDESKFDIDAEGQLYIN